MTIEKCTIAALLLVVSLMPSAHAQGRITDFNPKEEVLPILLSARADGSAWYSPSGIKPLTLLHFSDLHGSDVNLRRIVQFRDEYSEYIADAIHAGDVVDCYFDDHNPWETVDGARNMINVIGNHDCWKGHKTWAQTDIPYDATAEDVYPVFIAPYVDMWNVCQPSGVGDKHSKYYSACYFYKDYPDSKIRAVFLDCMHYDNVQDEWFKDVLSEASAKSYAVVGIQHYAPQTGLQCIESGFSTKPSIEATDPAPVQIQCMRDQAFCTLDTFISEGGQFICWLGGHEHADYIGYIPGHGRQLQILVDKAGVMDKYIHEDRTPGTVNEDAFNLLTINPTKNLLVIQRIGCKVGPNMQGKSLFCYDYVTHNVIVNK